MSMPLGQALAPYAQGNNPSASQQGNVVTPSAVSSPKSSAIFKLGELLKTVVHNGRVFFSENDVDTAINVIDDFVSAFIPGAELPALFTGAERAMREDVSLRTPPGGIVSPVAQPNFSLDYTQLAKAILAEQQRIASGEG